MRHMMIQESRTLNSSIKIVSEFHSILLNSISMQPCERAPVTMDVQCSLQSEDNKPLNEVDSAVTVPSSNDRGSVKKICFHPFGTEK
jgi:hypothetical protein